ncbi:hypothetical protein J2Z79_001099 [Symbiobacterium terraclitae]|uniref:SipL SPOCS domain-containing protein n=1 Tax=Symbiobacterium terraclitae TaxID=557451 RepID=A0ABS4JQ96_9FIRM|nr:DUF3794 domain-containing protein [Symbiobacterium terraclitae]MBP2017714.1 hypothetical protein [Symbiobacterium terraclitae]
MAFEVEQVVGSGNVQQLLCQTIQLGADAEEIKQIAKTVIIDNCLVVFDKVIVDGRLRKDIMFKQASGGFPIPGTVQGCTGITRTVSGPVVDLDVEITFNALIPVPGAQPGDKCVVLQAFVEGEKEEPADIQPNGAFRSLVDKSIIFLCVKVVRDVVTDTLGNGMGASTTGVVVNGNGNNNGAMLCPQRRSTGFFPGGNGTIPRAKPGLLPGTFVGPTLIFPGVLNPGIPTTVPPMNAIVSLQGTQVQVTGQAGAANNMVSDVTTTGGTVIS